MSDETFVLAFLPLQNVSVTLHISEVWPEPMCHFTQGVAAMDFDMKADMTLL